MIDLRPRKLDAYIVRKFISTFFIALILIIGIVIIFDISEKIDDFVSKEAPLKAIIFDYYVNFVPYFMNMFSPLFVFITVIFFTSKMAADSEIIAILSCGISFHRMMVPYIFSASLIALLSLCLNLFVIPESNKTRLDFENKYIKTRFMSVGRNVHYQISPGEYVYAESFSSWNKTAYRFTLERIENNKLVSKISAESAVYDTTSGKWRLKKYFIRDYNEDLTDKIRSGNQIDTTLALSVKDFYLTENTVETLTYKELNDLIAVQRMRGDANVKFALIEKHTRFAGFHPHYNGSFAFVPQTTRRNRLEHRYRHRTRLHLHPLPEVQPDVRAHGRTAAGNSPLGTECAICLHHGLPLQDCA